MTRKEELEQIIANAQKELNKIVVEEIEEEEATQEQLEAEGKAKLEPLGFTFGWGTFERRDGAGYFEQVEITYNGGWSWYVEENDTCLELVTGGFGTLDQLIEFRAKNLPKQKTYTVTYTVKAFNRENVRERIEECYGFDGPDPVIEEVN